MFLSLSCGSGKVGVIRQPKRRVWQEVEDVGGVEDPECLEDETAELPRSADFTQE